MSPSPVPIPKDEAARLVTLRPLEHLTHDTLDKVHRDSLDRLCEMARVVLDIDRAYVSLMLADEQVLIGRANVDATRAPRDLAFCSYTIAQRELMMVDDATADSRFAHHPFVMGPFGLRFYAGAPLEVEGQPIGTFCVVHGQPRHLSKRDTDSIELITALARDQLLLIHEVYRLRQQQA